MVEAAVSTPDSPGTARSDTKKIIIVPYDDITRTREIANAPSMSWTLFSLNLLRGIAARPDFIEEPGRLANESHVSLVFDEVITGLRLRLSGAQGHDGVYPDMAIFGNALTSGFPIGALVGTDKVMCSLEPEAPADTRIIAEVSALANPVSAVSALSSLEILSCRGTYGHLHNCRTRPLDILTEALARYGILVQ